jgi:hypothetical protein
MRDVVLVLELLEEGEMLTVGHTDLRQQRRLCGIAEIAQDHADDKINYGSAKEDPPLLEKLGPDRHDLLWLENGDDGTNNGRPTEQGNDEPPVEHPYIVSEHQRQASEQTKKASEIHQYMALDEFLHEDAERLSDEDRCLHRSLTFSLERMRRL